MTHFRVYWLTCILTILAAAASATTIVLPTDKQLIGKSPVIVEGSVVRSVPVSRDGAIWTETTLSVDRTLKGDAAGEIIIREVGGEIDGRITKIWGAPQYAAGEHVMAFLTPTPRGDYQTMDLMVGKFSEQQTVSGRRLFVRDDSGANVTLLDAQFKPVTARNLQRDAGAFEAYVAAGGSGDANYGVEDAVLQRDLPSEIAAGGRLNPTSKFTLISEPSVYRWFTFERGGSARWVSFGSQPGYAGGGVNEVQTAMNAWNSYSAAKISYVYGGAGSGTSPGNARANGTNDVLFNDPNQEIAGTYSGSTGGVVGTGGFNGVAAGGNWTSTFAADASHGQGTFRAYEITEGNFVIQDGVTPSTGISSNLLAEISAHEFGHTLGFGHSTDGTALMYAYVTGRGPVLRDDDQVAARWLYPSGSAAPPPPPATIPAVPSGLTATPATGSITLQWIDNATNETGQGVYLSLGSAAFGKVADVAANVRSITLNGLAPGSYRAYVTAYNTQGESVASNLATATVPQSVAAGFVVTPFSGVAGQTNFTFTDQSTGAITSRSWNFGDGAGSTAASPSHVYASAGVYTTTLTVSGGGVQSQAQRTVSVAAPSPVFPAVSASFDVSPGSANVRDNVSFFDRSSGSPTSWSWSFGDGGTSPAQNPVHSWASAGTYTVTLTAANGGSSSTTSRQITIAAIAPYHSLVSVSAQTNGAGGSVWRTELTLFNAGNEAAGGQFVFLPGAGGSAIARLLYIAPKQSVTFGNTLLDLFGLSSGAGAIAIDATSPSSTPNLIVSSRTYTTGSSGTYGQAVPSVDSDGLQPTLYLTGLEHDTYFRTNLGLVNRSNSPVGTTMALYDEFGRQIGAATVTVPANNFQQGSLANYFPAIANGIGSRLSVRISSGASSAVSVYASVVDNKTQDPVYIQAIPAPSGSSMVLPAVGRAAGANGTFWRSDVNVFNPAGSTATYTLRYIAAGSDGRNAPARSFTLSPSAQATFSDVLSSFGVASGNGALEVRWNGGLGPVVTSRTFTAGGDGGTYGQSIDPVGAFRGDSFVTGLRSDGAYRSNVGFVNGSDATIGVTVTLLTSYGTTAGSAFVQLAPRSQAQYSL